MERKVPRMVKPELERELAAGPPVGAELPAHRPGHRRLLFVYPVGASNRNSPPIPTSEGVTFLASGEEKSGGPGVRLNAGQ